MISKCSKPITIKRQGQEKGWKKKEWVTCYNVVALSSQGGCGTHDLCGSCPIRFAIRQAFEHKKSFTDLEAALTVVTADDQTVECDAIISGSYFLLNDEENMILTVHDITRLKNTEKELELAKEKADNGEPQ